MGSIDIRFFYTFSFIHRRQLTKLITSTSKYSILISFITLFTKSISIWWLCYSITTKCKFTAVITASSITIITSFITFFSQFWLDFSISTSCFRSTTCRTFYCITWDTLIWSSITNIWICCTFRSICTETSWITLFVKSICVWLLDVTITTEWFLTGDCTGIGF